MPEPKADGSLCNSNTQVCRSGVSMQALLHVVLFLYGVAKQFIFFTFVMALSCACYVLVELSARMHRVIVHCMLFDCRNARVQCARESTGRLVRWQLLLMTKTSTADSCATCHAGVSKLHIIMSFSWLTFSASMLFDFMTGRAFDL